MIRFKDKVYEDYFIDPVTAVITDRNGVVQEQYTTPTYNRPRCLGMLVHQIQAHTAWGYIKGWDVHHKDDNKFNNVLSNLEYIEHEKHSSISHKDKTHKIFPEKYEKWIKNLSESHKGQIPFNKGMTGVYHMSEETREKKSAAQKGCRHSEETIKKYIGLYYWNNGEVCIRSKECPGEEWVIGMIKR